MNWFTVLRAKAVIAEHGVQLLLGVSLLGLLLISVGGWGYLHPPTTEVTDNTHQRTIRQSLHTNATVTGNTSLYRAGTNLTDQPMYLFESAPSVTLRWRTSVSDNATTHVVQDVDLVYSGTHNGEVFWRKSRSLVHEETTTESGPVETRTTLNLSAIRTRRDTLRSELGDAGSVRVDLRVTTSYETPRYAGNLSETVPIELTNSWYAFGSTTTTRTHGTPVTRTESLPTRNAVTYLMPIGAGLACLAIASGIGGVLYRGVDQDRIDRRIQQTRYDPWISVGELANEPGETTVAVESLEDLVDIAIDTENRVIYDPDRDVNAVIDGRVVYCYSSDGVPFEST